MTDLPLRDLASEDRDPIGAILVSAGVFRPDEVVVGLELVDESLNPTPQTTYRWVVAGPVGRPVGFACFGPVPMTDGTFDLYWIVVDPALRGSGLACRLDEAVTEAVRGEGARWLLAETSSTSGYEPARRFYLKQGYRPLGCIPDYYRVGDDRLTFGKRLDGA